MGDGRSNYNVFVLHEGYSKASEDGTCANCSCVLIMGNKKVIVDTMTPWDGPFLLGKLAEHGVAPGDVDYVVSTHGHSDHCGNNNLFLGAVHIVGFTVSRGNHFYRSELDRGGSYAIDDFVEVVPTPGHMLAHVSVRVTTADGKTVVVAGDLFENEHDILDDSIWKEAGSECEMKQIENRSVILKTADYIIPGHGKMFEANKYRCQ